MILKDFKPDVIISSDEKATYNLKAFAKCNAPVIQIFHQPPAMNLERIATDVSLDKRMCLSAVESCECLVVLLKRDVSDLKEIINVKKITVMPNVVPQLNNVASYDNKKIITVGRVDRRQKRTHLLIEAMYLLKQKGFNWDVEIWGDCNYDKKYYEELVLLLEKYNLTNVKFMGTTKNILDKLEDASIFALPSWYEGFPLALTEAMSIGLPCVGFKNSHAVNELIIDGHNGVLCNESVEAFAAGLENLMIDVKKRIEYGKNAKKDMKAYSPKNIWDRWEQLIEEVVKENQLAN